MENITLPYDTQRFPFANVLRDLFSSHLGGDVGDLARLHDLAAVSYPVFSEHTDQSTVFHSTFYKHMEEAFLPLYRDFMKEFVQPRYYAPLVFQRVPTFRVHLPGNLSVGSFHRDSDFGHDAAEQNWWLPCTEARDTSAVWVESVPGRGDYQPREAIYGEVILFDGANLVHGNKINKTGQTRVSFDFRVVPRSEFRESQTASMTANKKFTLGDYWAE
jgi:hypothetical protein